MRPSSRHPKARALAVANRENARLRNALLEMLKEEEASEMDGNWCWGDGWPKPPRLCGMLARYIRYELGRRANLARLKQSRRALGLRWWGGLDYEHGLQPGQHRWWWTARVHSSWLDFRTWLGFLIAGVGDGE